MGLGPGRSGAANLARSAERRAAPRLEHPLHPEEPGPEGRAAHLRPLHHARGVRPRRPEPRHEHPSERHGQVRDNHRIPMEKRFKHFLELLGTLQTYLNLLELLGTSRKLSELLGSSRNSGVKNIDFIYCFHCFLMGDKQINLWIPKINFEPQKYVLTQNKK